MAGLTLPMVSMVADELLLPLDALVDAYGQDIQGLFGDQLAAGRINRQLYAIPGDAYCARAGGVMVNMELAQAARLTIPETSPVKAPSWKICLPRKPIATSAIERANGSRAAIFRRIV